jgi:hypothetical protein
MRYGIARSRVRQGRWLEQRAREFVRFLTAPSEFRKRSHRFPAAQQVLDCKSKPERSTMVLCNRGVVRAVRGRKTEAGPVNLLRRDRREMGQFGLGVLHKRGIPGKVRRWRRGELMGSWRIGLVASARGSRRGWGCQAAVVGACSGAVWGRSGDGASTRLRRRFRNRSGRGRVRERRAAAASAYE